VAKMNVSFEADIPKIVREGSERKSKYDTLLDKVKAHATNPKTLENKRVAVLTFDGQGKATSRYTSIKEAVAKREDKDNWKVAVRTHAEDNYRLYIKWLNEVQETEPEVTEDPEPETEEDDDDLDF
jgi:hypothetical protein